MPLRMHLLDYNLQKCRKGKQKGLKNAFFEVTTKNSDPPAVRVKEENFRDRRP